MKKEENESKKNSQASLISTVGKAMDYSMISFILMLCLWALISFISI